MLADAAVGAGDIIGLLLGNGGLLIALIVAIISVVRGDWVPRTAHEATVKGVADGKDAVIAEVRAQLAESEARGDKYEEYYWRLSESLRQTVATVATVAESAQKRTQE